MPKSLKPATSPKEQIETLRSRGMHLDDSLARQWLESVRTTVGFGTNRSRQSLRLRCAHKQSFRFYPSSRVKTSLVRYSSWLIYYVSLHQAQHGPKKLLTLSRVSFYPTP